jgi:hypothetical protein
MRYDLGQTREREAGMYEEWEDDQYEIDGVGFAEPGGGSALRAATRDNPRDQPCPSCELPNKLTRIDVMRHYVCDGCADRAERDCD